MASMGLAQLARVCVARMPGPQHLSSKTQATTSWARPLEETFPQPNQLSSMKAVGNPNT
jgi:hypothetical protein